MGKTAVKTVKKKIRRICYEVRKFWRRFGKDFGEEAEGFTYVETVAVIAIGAVLTAGSVFSATKLIASARKTAAILFCS